jgi:hypothetical protein
MNKKDAEEQFFKLNPKTSLYIEVNQTRWLTFVYELEEKGLITEKQADSWKYPNKQKSKFSMIHTYKILRK